MLQYSRVARSGRRCHRRLGSSLHEQVALAGLVHAQVVVQVEHVEEGRRYLLARPKEEEDARDEWPWHRDDQGAITAEYLDAGLDETEDELYAGGRHRLRLEYHVQALQRRLGRHRARRAERGVVARQEVDDVGRAAARRVDNVGDVGAAAWEYAIEFESWRRCNPPSSAGGNPD